MLIYYKTYLNYRNLNKERLGCIHMSVHTHMHILEAYDNMYL